MMSISENYVCWWNVFFSYLVSPYPEKVFTEKVNEKKTNWWLRYFLALISIFLMKICMIFIPSRNKKVDVLYFCWNSQHKQCCGFCLADHQIYDSTCQAGVGCMGRKYHTVFKFIQSKISRKSPYRTFPLLFGKFVRNYNFPRLSSITYSFYCTLLLITFMHQNDL